METPGQIEIIDSEDGRTLMFMSDKTKVALFNEFIEFLLLRIELNNAILEETFYSEPVLNKNRMN